MVLAYVWKNFLFYKEDFIKMMNYMGLDLRKLIIHLVINLDVIIKDEKMVRSLKKIKNKLDIMNIVKIF